MYTVTVFLKNFHENFYFYKTCSKYFKISKNLAIFFNIFYGISCSMGYLPNSKGLQGMNDIDEG